MDKIPKLKYIITVEDFDKTVKLLKFNLNVISANLSLCDSNTQVSFKPADLNQAFDLAGLSTQKKINVTI